MRKRVFSILLSIAVCLSMMPVGAWAETSGEGGTAKQSSNVAEVKIGETVTQYADITEAFAAAQKADSAEVKLLNNAEITTTNTSNVLKGIELLEGGNITLDLNGKTLSGKQTSVESTASDSILISVYDPCTLTVKDSSGGGAIVQSNSVAAVRAAGAGTLIIDSGTIENTSSQNQTENCAVLVMGSSNVTINGGTIKGTYKGIYVNSYDSSATLTVTGSSQIHGEKSNALLVEKAKSVTLSGGTFTTNATDNHSILNSSGTAESLLADGYRYEDGEGNQAAYSENKNGVIGKAAVSFVKDEVTYVYTYWTNPGEFKTKTISDFTYIDENTTTLNEGFYVVKGTVTINGDVTAASDNVSIILCDDSNLTINGSLILPETAIGREVKIYGQKDSSGSMTVTSNDDFAIKYSGENPRVDVAWVNVYGGNLTAAGSDKATASSVWLYAGPNMMMKCTDLIKNEPVAKNDLMHIGENTASFRFERCTEHEWEYTNDSENTDSHYKYCSLCSFYGGAETHSASMWTCKDDKHTGYCVCGKEMETEAHDLTYAVNADGLTHSQKCSKCDYAAAPETHNFNKTETTEGGATYSACEKCDAYLIAEYNDEKYASLQSAVNKAAEVGGTVTLAAELVGDEITVTEGNVTIDLNGKKWAMSYVTYIPLTVDGGNVTLKNGKIHQSGSSSDARSAIVVKRGSLTLGSDVSVQGGSAKNGAQYSVDLQGGSLTLNQGAALLTGMKVPDGHTLSEYLPEGSAFVKCEYTEESGVQIPDTADYVTEAYTANEYTGAMAVTAHTHKGISCACGFVCDHSAIDENGYCSQCQMTFEAKNGETYYESLATALREAKDGETVTLLKNNVMSADITLGGSKTINLDLNSKEIKSAGENLQSIIIESGATLAVSNTKISSMSSNGKPLVITFEVKSGGMLDLCPAGYVVDNTYKGTVSCVKLAGGGRLRSFGGWISNLELTAPYEDYDVNLRYNSDSDCAKINGISSESATLTVGDVLAKNHAGYVLRGRNSETWANVPNTTLLKDMKNWTRLYVTECDHGDENSDAACDYCGTALVVKVEARKGDSGVTSIKYFALKNKPNSTQNGYALAISTMNGTLSTNGYTYREMTLLCDADNLPDLSGDFTLNGNGKNINGKVTVRSGANIIFHKVTCKGEMNISGTAQTTFGTAFSGGSVTVWSSGVMTTEMSSTITSPVTVKAKGTLNVNSGYLKNVTFSEGSSGIIKGGSFGSLKIDEKRTLDTLLAEGYAYHDGPDTSKVVNGVVTSLSGVYILEHTHKFAGSNSCACGYTCEHEIDSNGVCSKCKTQFAAAVTTGSDTEYVTDIYDAFAAAGSGSTIRLLADTSLDKSFEFTTGDVILDLNGKVLNGKTVTVSAGSKVKITDSVGAGSMASIIANGGELNITGGSVTKLDVKHAENISISGGSFDSIVNSTVSYFDPGILLADGYAFKQNGSFKKRDDTVYKDATVENLTIAQCMDGEHYSKYSSDGYICAYCNKKIVAGIGTAVVKHYADLGNAIADADCNEYRAVTIIRDITLDQPIIISKHNASNYTLYIDLQNHKISSGAGFSGSMFTVKDGYIAFRDGSIEAEGADGITVTGGSLEVGSSASASGAGCAAIRLKGGKLNVSTGSVASSGNAYAIIAESGDELLIKADQSFGKLKVAATYAGSMLLRAGTYSSIETAGGKFKTVNDLLAESYKFVYTDTENDVDGNTTKVENVKIVHHHIYNDEGQCTAGGETHWADAKVTGTGDSSIDRFYDTLEEALKTAEKHAGCTVTVWGNAEPKNTVTVSKGEFTIDFNHPLGNIRGFYSDWIGSVLKIAGGNIEITGDDDCGIFSQGKGNTALEISGGTVTVTGGRFMNNSGEGNNLIYLNGGTLILQGGTFVNYAGAVFKTKPSDYGSLLGTGYAYADENGNLMKLGDMKNNIESFKVVECTDHQPDADGRCIYCEEKCVAEVSAGETVTKYIDLNKAFEAAKADEGAAVKLLDNITGGASSDGSLTLDLNGKTVDKIEITDGKLTVSGSGSINTLNIKNGALDISNNGVRISALTAAENGKAALTAGTFGSISVSEGRKIAELLAPEYSYRIGDGWASIEQRESGSLTGDITVAITPITSLTVTADSESVIYGYKTAPKLTAVPVLADGKTASYKWYRVTGDTVEVISGAVDSECTVPEDLDKGTYTYRCEVTADGYTISEEVTVTVNEKVIDNDSAEVKLNNSLTYNGKVQEPDFTITVDGRKLVKGTDYDVTYSDKLCNAGEYTATITGKGNYSGSAETLFTVAKKQLKVSDITVSPKTYDGSKAADITEVIFDGLVTGETLEKGTDYTVTGEFNSADVKTANKITATVKLADNVKNYELAKETLDKEASIAKADAQCTAPKAVADLVYTGEAQQLVTAGSSEHGDMVYSLEQNGAYSSEIPTAVNAGDYDVWYKVIGDDNHNDSNPVSVKVTVNRADAVFEAPKAVIGLEYTGEAHELVTAGSTNDGIMVYSLSETGEYTETIPTVVNAGNYNVWYKVKGDSNHRDSEPALVEVSIAKATPTGEPAYDRIGEKGKTLADANIAVKDKDGKGKFSVAGTVKWEADDTAEVKQGSKYKWIFTPESDNYNTITGEVTLWPKPSSGGGAAPAADGETLRIVVTANMQLKESQKPASDAIGNTGVIFEVAAYIGNTRIYDLKEGKAEILLPIPENLKDKDIAVIYINDKGICQLISHTAETGETGSFVKFTTSQFANYAVVEKANAEKLIEKQNIDKVKNSVKEVKLKAITSKTSKKNVRVKIGEVKNLNSLIKEADAMGYTVKYKYYRSVKKSSKYTAKVTKKSDTYINAKGRKGTKYYYKARVFVYNGKKMIAQTELKQCRYGVRTWSK